jgi:hypothetical protein
VAGTIPDADKDGAAVGLEHSSRGCPKLSALADDAKAAQPPHVLPSCRADNLCDVQVASCEYTQISEMVVSDADRQSGQILLDVFVRRALSAGDEMDSRVDSIRDAVRRSNSSSAWFTR